MRYQGEKRIQVVLKDKQRHIKKIEEFIWEKIYSNRAAPNSRWLGTLYLQELGKDRAKAEAQEILDGL